MFRVDLHTHSTLSADGGIGQHQYKQLLDKNILHAVAITDHDEVDFALDLHQQRPEQVIVGEEVSTSEGHLIGLFLYQRVASGLSYRRTATLIREQGGIVYAPHPGDRRRRGVEFSVLSECLKLIDIVEGFNARFFSEEGNVRAANFSRQVNKPIAVGSDAHSVGEIGTTYNNLTKMPTRENLLSLLSSASHVQQQVGWWAAIAPTRNRFKKKIAQIWTKKG